MTYPYYIINIIIIQILSSSTHNFRGSHWGWWILLFYQHYSQIHPYSIHSLSIFIHTWSTPGWPYSPTYLTFIAVAQEVPLANAEGYNATLAVCSKGRQWHLALQLLQRCLRCGERCGFLFPSDLIWKFGLSMKSLRKYRKFCEMIGKTWFENTILESTILKMIWSTIQDGRYDWGTILEMCCSIWVIQEPSWDCNATTNDTRVLILYCICCFWELKWSWNSVWSPNSCDVDREGVT